MCVCVCVCLSGNKRQMGDNKQRRTDGVCLIGSTGRSSVFFTWQSVLNLMAMLIKTDCE